jgi:DNA-binding transcriptional LysR family regulator
MSSFSQLLGRLRFKQLALLAALDEHRNLHRAADAVHLAQPSATKLVHDLEKIFSFPLFERLPRGMQPTELGADRWQCGSRFRDRVKRVYSDAATDNGYHSSHRFFLQEPGYRLVILGVVSRNKLLVRSLRLKHGLDRNLKPARAHVLPNWHFQ